MQLKKLGKLHYDSLKFYVVAQSSHYFFFFG